MLFWICPAFATPILMYDGMENLACYLFKCDILYFVLIVTLLRPVTRGERHWAKIKLVIWMDNRLKFSHFCKRHSKFLPLKLLAETALFFIDAISTHICKRGIDRGVRYLYLDCNLYLSLAYFFQRGFLSLLLSSRIIFVLRLQP